MATKKVHFCDNCGKEIKKEKGFLHFPFHGWVGKIFCDQDCLTKWAVSVSEIHKAEPIINLN